MRHIDDQELERLIEEVTREVLVLLEEGPGP